MFCGLPTGSFDCQFSFVSSFLISSLRLVSNVLQTLESQNKVNTASVTRKSGPTFKKSSLPWNHLKAMTDVYASKT